MKDLKFNTQKVAAKLVTAVTILGLATGCVHEQVRNEDPAQDLPAITLNDPPKEEFVSNDNLDLAAGDQTEQAAAESSDQNLALDSDSSSNVDASPDASPSLAQNIEYSAPAELPPLAQSPSVPQKSTRHSKHKTKRLAKNAKKGQKKIAKHGKKAAKIARDHKKSAKKPVETVAAVQVPQVPPSNPSADALLIDGAPSAAGQIAEAGTDSSMTLPADSQIGANETTTIEPPIALSQAPEIAAPSDDSTLWIYWAGGMIVLIGSILLFVKRRRALARY